MIIWGLNPAETMRSVIDNGFYRVQHDAERQLVIMQRSRQSLAPAGLQLMQMEVMAALRPVRGQRLLIDVRLGPGNNDPSLEQHIQHFRRQLAELFPVSATLVATAVGRLQIMRMGRERRDGGIQVFLDEAEAIAYLMTQELLR